MKCVQGIEPNLSGSTLNLSSVKRALVPIRHGSGVSLPSLLRNPLGINPAIIPTAFLNLFHIPL